MNPHLQQLSAAYQACLTEAFRQCPQLIRRWLAALSQALYERSLRATVPAEKRQLQLAVAALKSSQSVIEEGFSVELTRAIAEDTRSAVAKKSSRATRSLSSISFDELELMGDDQVQEAMDDARFQQQLLAAADAGLAGLAARISTVQGSRVVQADRNPLRPEIISRALLALIRQLPADPDVRARWLTHGAQLLGNELQTFYASLNDFLAGQGVKPAAYGVVTAADVQRVSAISATDQLTAVKAATGASDDGGKASGTTSSGFLENGTAAGVSREQLLTLDHLHRLMAGDYDESFKHKPPVSGFGMDRAVRNDFSHTVPAAMDALTELKLQGLAGSSRNAARPVPPQSVALIREQLKTDAKSLGQSLAIEVVGLMIEQLVNDSRLLPPVRKIIANAEPAFLRMGVTDPRFFSDKSHPARRLLETITTKSLAYSSEEDAGFAGFMLDLQGVAELLTEEHASDARHFAGLLRDFEANQARRSRSTQQSPGLAVQALLQAEQRNLLAGRIASEIRARPDFIRGNRILTAFLTGPWAHVMANERLLGEHGGMGSPKAVFSLTLGDILWSLNTGEASRHRKRLMRIVPDILSSVRDGLLSIDFPLAESKEFFQEMMDIHQAALKISALKAVEDFRQADAAGEALDLKVRNRTALEKAFEARDSADAQLPWLAPTEAQQSGFMDSVDRDSHADFEATVPRSNFDDEGSAGDNAAQDADDPAESVDLAIGSWVELLADTRWLRAQLTWISPHNTLYMFTSQGDRSHSMTARVLKNLLRLQLVRVVSQQGVLDGALDNVARAAMRNSVDNPKR